MIPGCGKILVKMIHKRVALRCHSYCFGRECERYSQMGNPGAPRDPADGAVWGIGNSELQITNYALQICPQGKAPGRRKGIVRKQFTFYGSFYESLAILPIEQAQQGLWAIVTYGLFGKLPKMEIEPAALAVFKMATPVLDAARKKSQGAVNSQEKRKRRKEKSESLDRIPSGYAQDTLKEGEKEKEKEVEVEKEVELEVEVEKELEIETEKESLYTDSVCVNRDTDTDRFERFWDFYPVKLGKQKAWEAWQEENPDLDKAITALECWKRSRQWRQENGRYIPKAANFLKEKYFLQIPEGSVPMGASGHLGMAEMEAIENLMRG